MPQIANQDYIIVKQTLPQDQSLLNDAHVLGELKRNFLQGTIFDVIIETPMDNGPSYGRVLSAGQIDNFFVSIQLFDGIEYGEEINYSVEQYEGLAAIQQAAIAAGKEVDRIPELIATSDTQGHGVLVAKVKDEVSLIVLNENGNGLVPVVDNDGKITELSDCGYRPEVENTQGYITISSEDIQKLIGLPISKI